MVRRRRVFVWGGSVVLTGFFNWVLSWRVRSGLLGFPGEHGGKGGPMGGSAGF